MRILVTGSRRSGDAEVGVIKEAILDAARGHDEVVLVHGCADGVDLIADRVARDQGWKIERYPVRPEDYRQFGRFQAPKRRNQKMVDAGADVCLAFPAPGSRGTYDCARRAADAHIRVVMIEVAR